MGYEPRRRALYLVFSSFRAVFSAFCFFFDLGFFAGFFFFFLFSFLLPPLNAACVIACISLLVSDLLTFPSWCCIAACAYFIRGMVLLI